MTYILSAPKAFYILVGRHAKRAHVTGTGTGFTAPGSFEATERDGPSGPPRRRARAAIECRAMSMNTPETRREVQVRPWWDRAMKAAEGNLVSVWQAPSFRMGCR